MLITLQKLNEINKELKGQEAALQELHTVMAREKKRLDTARKTKQELDLKAHEVKLTEDQIGGNSSSSVSGTITCFSVLFSLTGADYSSGGGDEAEHNAVERSHRQREGPP